MKARVSSFAWVVFASLTVALALSAVTSPSGETTKFGGHTRLVAELLVQIEARCASLANTVEFRFEVRA